MSASVASLEEFADFSTVTPWEKLVASIEHHLSEWTRVGAAELVRQYLDEEARNAPAADNRKSKRFRRTSFSSLEVSALPPLTPPLVSTRPEPYLLTLHIPLAAARKENERDRREGDGSFSCSLAAADGAPPPGLGPHVAWGRRDGKDPSSPSPSPSVAAAAHRACVWFNVGGPFVTLQPATYSRRVLDLEREAATLVSALAVASGSSRCPWPCAIPSGDGRRDAWLGVGPAGRGLVESEACRRLGARASGPPRRLQGPAGLAALLASRCAARAPGASRALRAALEPDEGIGSVAAALAAASNALDDGEDVGGDVSASCPASRLLRRRRRVAVEVDARATYLVPLPPPARLSPEAAIAEAVEAAERRQRRLPLQPQREQQQRRQKHWDEGAPWKPWLLFDRGCYPDPLRGGVEVDACWDAVPGREAFGLDDGGGSNEPDEGDEDDDERSSSSSEDEGRRRTRGGVRASSVWRVYCLAPPGSNPFSSLPGIGAGAEGTVVRAPPLHLLPDPTSPPPHPPTGGLASLVERLASARSLASRARSMRDLDSDAWWDARGTDRESPVWPLPRSPAPGVVAAAAADVLDVVSDPERLLPGSLVASARRGGDAVAEAAVAAVRGAERPPPIPSPPSSSSLIHLRLPRLAPPDSLASRLALRAAALAAASAASAAVGNSGPASTSSSRPSSSSGSPFSSSSTGDARAVAALWSVVVRELRFSCWEAGERLPRCSSVGGADDKRRKRMTKKNKKRGDKNNSEKVKPRLPDKTSSLLHQKLQMLDCCIAARVAAAEKAAAEAAAAAAAACGGSDDAAAAAAGQQQRSSWLPWPLSRALSTLAPAPGSSLAGLGQGEDGGDAEMIDAGEEEAADAAAADIEQEEEGEEGWASAASSSVWTCSSSDDDEDDDEEGDDDDEENEGQGTDVTMSDAAAASVPRRTRSAAAAASASPPPRTPRLRPPKGARGVLRVIPDGRAKGKLPLCVPKTQKRPPETSDAEDARLSAAWALRERAMTTSKGNVDDAPSSSLAAADALASPLVASDMSSFKAANPASSSSSRNQQRPEATLEDFLSWRVPRGSPPPWATAAASTTATATTKSKSSRKNDNIKIDVEAWRGVWEASPARPLSQQRPLFDPEAEGERALHWLETLPPTSAWAELVPLAAAAAAELLASSPGASTFPAATSFDEDEENGATRPRQKGSALATFCDEVRPLLLALDHRSTYNRTSDGGGSDEEGGGQRDESELLSRLAGAVARVEPTLLAAEALRRRFPGGEEINEKKKNKKGEECLASRVLSAATGWSDDGNDASNGGGGGVTVSPRDRAAFDALMRSGAASAAAAVAAAAGPLATAVAGAAATAAASAPASSSAAAASLSSSHDRGPSKLAVAVPGWGPPLQAEWTVRCEVREEIVERVGGGNGVASSGSERQRRQQQQPQQQETKNKTTKTIERLVGCGPGWRGGQRAHVRWCPSEGVRLSCVVTPEEEEGEFEE